MLVETEAHGLLVAELTPRLIKLRPKGTRSLKLRVAIPWGAIYQRALEIQLALPPLSPPSRRKPRRLVRRGLL